MTTNQSGATEPAETRRRFLVSGRVQGVGFRAWTLRRARALALRGVVKNLAHGAVEIEAAGPIDSLERLHELLRRGPPLAQVREVRELPPTDVVLPNEFDVAF